MKKSLGSIVKSEWFSALMLGALSLVSAPAFAASTSAKSMADIASNLITGQLSIIPDFISAVCYCTGIYFVAQGVLRLRDHADNPNSAKLWPALARLFVGAALISLPVVTILASETLSISSSVSGSTFQGFGVGTITSGSGS
jgi:hypothetical protein